VIAAVLKLVLVGGLVHFQSPSGNINCYAGPAFQGSPAFAQCLVRKQSWPSLRARPASCDLDWDPATVSLSRRRATVGSCRGDIGPLCVNTSDRCSTLGYGRSVDVGPIRCTSTTAGVTCRYRTGRRQGFLIARERYVLYR
jgi:Family of unknown function (DUF6636)